jgi:hypothetical protein
MKWINKGRNKVNDEDRGEFISGRISIWCSTVI